MIYLSLMVNRLAATREELKKRREIHQRKMQVASATSLMMYIVLLSVFKFTLKVMGARTLLQGVLKFWTTV
jgi:hypothetical protein